MMFDCGLQNIFQLKSGQSRSINWENRNGEKGKGGMASSDLGPSRKGSPCIPKIEAGETAWRFLLLRLRCFLPGKLSPDCCQSDPWFQQLFPDAVP